MQHNIKTVLLNPGDDATLQCQFPENRHFPAYESNVLVCNKNSAGFDTL